MKVLHITPEAPGNYSGGKIVVRQTLFSLLENNWEVDYIGPEIEEKGLKEQYSNVYILDPSKNLLLRLYDTLHMNTNKRYRSWLELKLDFSQYDVIVMDFTKLDYVLKRVPGDKVIVRVHNVEQDYSAKNYEYKKTFVNYLDKKFSGIRERRIVNSVGSLIVLTNKDKERLHYLYGVPYDKMTIVPVCINKKLFKPVERKRDEIQMLLTGSLWFGPNYEGIKWFLDHVYTKLSFPKKLIIAGSCPNEELIEKVNRLEGVTLIDSPNSMESYFQEADIAITPVFDGAGMKVKVAEALSFGVPVMGTEHAFEGYDIINGVNSYCGNDAAEFIEYLTKFSELTSEQRYVMQKECYRLFEEKYSQKRSSDVFKEVVKKIYERAKDKR